MFNDVFNNVIHPMVTNFPQFSPQQLIPQGVQQFIPQGMFAQAPQVAQHATNIFGS